MKALITLPAADGPAPEGNAATSETLARGERAYQKCYSCHALEPGRNDLGGPTLYRIVGRQVAAEAGFDYSPALRRFAERSPRWSPALLDRLIADPEVLVPGTSMSFHGIADAGERSDLLLFLDNAGDPKIRRR